MPAVFAVTQNIGCFPAAVIRKGALMQEKYDNNTIPSITTLECICDAFGITLAQFFAEDAMLVQLSAEQKTLFDQWVTLTPSQKHLLAQLVKELKRV